jgi:heavy metal sensor kinase
MINTRSIQFRLIAWYSGLVVVVSCAFGAYVYRGVKARLYSDMEQTLQRRAHQIAADILPRLSTDPPAVVQEEIHDIYSPETTDRLIRILRLDGSVFYLSGSPTSGLFDPSLIPRPVSLAEGKRTVLIDKKDDMIIALTRGKVGTETYSVEMGAPTTGMQRVLDRLVTTLAVGLPLVILVVGTGGYVLVRRSLLPVEQLRTTAQQLTFNSSGSQLPVVKTGDAIEELAVTLNQMLERLRDAYQQATRFSADASHELRTPLTIVRSELESLLRRDTTLSDSIRDRVASVLEEAERLSSITESLFSLSRLDAGEAKMEDVAVDLSRLAGSTVDQMRLLADEKNLALSVDAPATVTVVGDPARLKQVIVDLLDNAIKYTPDEGRITLKVYAAPKRAVLEVIDTGIGIDAAALPRIFDRFYRAERARLRNSDGAGLGLSIVRSICQAHGGTVEIKSEEGQGTTCRVELPLAA